MWLLHTEHLDSLHKTSVALPPMNLSNSLSKAVFLYSPISWTESSEGKLMSCHAKVIKRILGKELKERLVVVQNFEKVR